MLCKRNLMAWFACIFVSCMNQMREFVKLRFDLCNSKINERRTISSFSANKNPYLDKSMWVIQFANDKFWFGLSNLGSLALQISGFEHRAHPNWIFKRKFYAVLIESN